MVEAAKIVRNHDLQPCGQPDRPEAALLGPLRAARSGGRLPSTLELMHQLLPKLTEAIVRTISEREAAGDIVVTVPIKGARLNFLHGN